MSVMGFFRPVQVQFSSLKVTRRTAFDQVIAFAGSRGRKLLQNTILARIQNPVGFTPSVGSTPTSGTIISRQSEPELAKTLCL